MEENVTTYHNILEGTRRRCYNISGTSCKLMEEDVTTYQKSQTLRGEDATTYQERLGS